MPHLSENVKVRSKESGSGLVELLSLNRLIQTVDSIAIEERDQEEMLQLIVNALCIFTGWPLGNVFLRDSTHPTKFSRSPVHYVRNRDVYGESHQQLASNSYDESSRNIQQMMAQLAPFLDRDLELVVPGEGGVSFGVLIPIVSRGQLFGFFELVASEEKEPSQHLMQVFHQIGYRIGVVMEINTQLKKSYADLEEKIKKLKELDKLKDDFLNVSAHELQTPIIPIHSQVELLMAGDYGKLNKEQKNALEMIYRNETRLSELVNDILDIAKIRSMKLKLIFSQASLAEIITNAVENVEGLAREKNISLTLNPVPDLPKIVVDKKRISQVMGNLLGNALKFTPKKGRIEVTVKQTKNNVLVSVHDTGIGINQAGLNKLFTPFFQVDSNITRKYGGTGLGLSICEGLILGHKGKIWAESAGKGKGSTFTFSLPTKKKVVIIKL